MKKIEAIIRAQNFIELKSRISKIGAYLLVKQEINDNEIFENQHGSKIGSTNVKSIPLVKIELVIPDVDAKKVIRIISESSGIKPSNGGKIFVSEMTEIVDINTLEGEKELEVTTPTKRSRLVPLQKYTLTKVEEFYEQNKVMLLENYKIKSFSDFVNFCILEYLPELQQKFRKMSYDLNSVRF
ncbi:MAG: P-II family nitrogen regulator [Candidatus Nitrosotenuis sp.]